MAGKEPPPAKGAGRSTAKAAPRGVSPPAKRAAAKPASKAATPRPREDARVAQREQAAAEAALRAQPEPALEPRPEPAMEPVADTAIELLPDRAAGPGPRYLGYLAGLLLVVGLFERSDLLSTPGLYALIAGMAVATAAGAAIAMRRAQGAQAEQGEEAAESALGANHYLVPVMAVIVAGAVSALVSDWRLHVGSQALMAAAVFSATYVTLARFEGRRRPGHDFLQDAALILVLLGAYIAVLAGVPNIGLRLVLIFVATAIAAFENLSRAGPGYGRAAVGGIIVAQVVTAIAFGLISYQFLDVARLATILLVAWYVNRGMGYHLIEGTMSAGIFVEYAIGAVVCAALVATAILAH